MDFSWVICENEVSKLIPNGVPIMNNFTKDDWKLFQERLPNWQERYMGRLNRKYQQILSQDKENSTIFWQLEKAIKKDRKSSGVELSFKRSELPILLARLLNDNVIEEKELADFSEPLRKIIKILLRY